MAKPKKRIILTGAQCTGKTTLMNALTTDGTKKLSIAREAAIKSNWTPEKGSSEEYQKELFKEMYKALSSKKNYVSDRGLSCVAAYTFNEAIVGNIAKKVAETQYKKLIKFHKDNPDVLLVYVPVEFELVSDGVRDIEKANQNKIDFLIKNMLETTGVKYLTVTGSVEERVNQIEMALELFNS